VFQIGRTDYTPNCGLWFAVQWPGAEDPTARTRVETLLTHLGDRGLGGERSVGFGQFTWAAGAAMPDAPEPTAGGAALSLSRYLPRPEELPGALQGSAAYRLVAVSGWLQSPGREARRRRQVRLLTEGSVFQTVGAGPWGRLADVRPAGWDGHAVWRYGYACPVGLGPKEAVDG